MHKNKDDKEFERWFDEKRAEQENIKKENKMNKSTPGPWLVRDKRYIDLPNRGKNYQAICQVGSYGVRISKVDEANARLIAAAPDLLETCKALVTAVPVEVEANGGKANDNCAIMVNALCKAKAAIAKTEKG